MRRIFALAAMFALLLPAWAAAQDHHDNKAPPPHPGPHGPPPPHPAFKPPPPHGPAGRRRIRSSSRSPRSTARWVAPNPQFKPVNPQHGPMGGPNPAFVHPRHPAAPVPAFVHGPHAPPPGSVHFSFHGHPFNRFHAAPFVYPHGWRGSAPGPSAPRCRRCSSHRPITIPVWAELGLEPPQPGFQWVRYGPDLLLVDVNTGQVLDVAYGVFYED